MADAVHDLRVRVRVSRVVCPHLMLWVLPVKKAVSAIILCVY